MLCAFTSASDPYKVLGVKPGASEKEIKDAYKKMALKHHPDRNPGDPSAEKRFKAVSEAYAQLSSGSHSSSTGGGATGNGGFGGRGPFPGGTSGGFSNEDAERMFREFFGRGGFPNGFPNGAGGGFQQMQQEIFQGPDGRMRMRTTRIMPDGKRHVEETNLGSAGAGPFGAGPFGAGPFGAGPFAASGGFGPGGRGRQMSQQEKEQLARAQEQAQAMLRGLAKEAASHMARAAADAAKRAARRTAENALSSLFRALTGRGGPGKGRGNK